MSPPSRAELVDFDSLDHQNVLSFFLGKSADEAGAMYRSDYFTMSGREAFAYMSVHGLEYYLPPAMSYIESRDSDGDWEFVMGILSSLSDQAFNEGVRGSPLLVDLIQRLADFVRVHPQKFEIDQNDPYLIRTLREIGEGLQPSPRL